MNAKVALVVACVLVAAVSGARVDSLRGKHAKPIAAMLETKAAAKRGPLTCVTSGDTHVNPFDSLRYYDIHEYGVYVMTSYTAARAEESFAVQIRQEQWIKNSNNRAATNRDVAVRCGRDTVAITYPASSTATPRTKINGVEVVVGSRCERNLPNSPERGGNYCVYRRSRHQYTVLCGDNVAPDAGAAQKYAWGMEAHFDFVRAGQRTEYGNARVHLHHSYVGHLEGACGMFKGCSLTDRSSRCQPNNPAYQHFQVAYKDSIFQSAVIKPTTLRGTINPADYKVDQRQVDARKPKCQQFLTQATGVSEERTKQLLEHLDDALESKLENYAGQCAFDDMIGLTATLADVKENVCGLIETNTDANNKDLNEALANLRKCKGDPEKVLTPILSEQWALAQFCNANPPKEAKPVADYSFPGCEQQPTGSLANQIKILAGNVRLGIQKALARAKNEWSVQGGKMSTEVSDLDKKKTAKQTEVDQNNDQIKSSDAKLTQARTKVKDLKKKIEVNAQEVTTAKQEKSAAEAQRKTDKENCSQKESETLALIAVIDKVLTKMSTLKAGTEFLQIEAAAKAHSDSKVRGIVDNTMNMMRLMQLAAKADETAKNDGDAAKPAPGTKTVNASLLKELLNKLRAQLVDYLKEIRGFEAKAVADFVEADKLKQTQIETSTNTGNQFSTQLETAEENLVQLAQANNDLKKDAADLEAELKAIEAELAAKKKEYNDAKAAHNSEIDRLQKELATVNEVEKTLIHHTEGAVTTAKAHLQDQIKKLAKAYL